MKHQLNEIAEITGLNLQDVADLITWACEKHWPLESCEFRTDGEVHEIWFEEQAISVDSLGQRFEMTGNPFPWMDGKAWRKI
jgi:molybdenum cofactor biosynthesis enzyme MoaA